jgi:hypothetical protein
MVLSNPTHKTHNWLVFGTFELDFLPVRPSELNSETSLLSGSKIHTARSTSNTGAAIPRDKAQAASRRLTAPSDLALAELVAGLLAGTLFLAAPATEVLMVLVSEPLIGALPSWRELWKGECSILRCCRFSSKAASCSFRRKVDCTVASPSGR